ncbi:assembly of actin patch protein [Neocucurbitaria cava]|uniref:Assembly of actin patch protein n=1 Tax=Neocucurbitaria cava TaxID=798079 RepID=A0A9W9CHR8_9PLEO|nr:assembly of actin patch protein [Neocucurbitaria cava]
MYKVKALYDYSSPHEDDLSFHAGQIITVTEEEGDDWYVGEYTDDSGAKQDGLFPRNFVDKYEPEPPPRPNRASRHKPLEQPAAEAAPPTPEVAHHEPEPVQHKEPEAPKPQPPPLEVPPAAKPEPTPMSPVSPPSASSTKGPEVPQAQNEAAKPSPASKKPPPPVAAKSNAFRDRIAAFNAPAAAPIQPFKPSGASTTFIKKPFVAPPPSRNAYVPPPVRETPQAKTYRREEDPEIAERQAQDQDAAERAGLAAHDTSNTHEGEVEDQPKPTSLKERIALLQKQQQEQAERAAAALHKEKPKRPPVKKRTESHEGHAEDSEDAGLERVASGASKERQSMDHARPPRTSHDIKSPDSHHRHRELLSDANDADQSGAGETEDAGGESTSVEDDDERTRSRQPPPPPRAAAAPVKEPDVGDEQDVEEVEEDEEDDEMDAETRRKLELRERMAKMSGGMGMPGMFGGIPMGGLPPKKKKASTEKKAEEHEEYASPQQRVPMFGMPGMPSVKSPEEEDRQLAVGKEDEMHHPVTGSHRADEVPDVEDVASQSIQRTPTGERPPPIPSDRRSMPPPVPSASRPVPPPLPHIVSPGPGSESGDEMTDGGANAMSPRTPSAPFAPPNKRSSYFGSDDQSQDSPDRRVPPIPLASPTSPAGHRAPPPPPPTQAPPSRHADVPPRNVDRNEGETDYEGDYDTDIASGATHKDALKSHAKEPSMDESMIADEPTSARSPTTPYGAPPLPPSVPRAVPPPPPQQAPNRLSMDAPRSVPPLPPVPPPTRNTQRDEDDDEYDPFKYTAPPPAAAPPAPRAMPPPPQSQPPPPQNRPPPPMPPSIPPVPQHQQVESSDEDELYSAPPPRKSHDRPPPPPPQAPPHQYAPPPPPQERAAPHRRHKKELHLPTPQERSAPPPPPADAPPRVSMGRKSLDANRALGGRTSTDQPRPAANQDFMASDIDLGHSSHWWTQPKLLPPSLQNRKDVLIDMNETQSGNTVEKLIYVVYMDYSQTIISARFSTSNVSDVDLDQHHNAPPPRQRPDQLENAYEQFGRRIAKDVESKQNTVVGNGSPHGLIDELLKPYNEALPPVSTRAYGALVYANLANASTQSYDEIRPGDIVSFRNAKFQGKTGAMHAKYAVDVGKPDHVGVVVEWDGSKKKVRVWEQGREHKKVKPESFKMGDLRSGEVRVWRVMSKSWVGWN